MAEDANVMRAQRIELTDDQGNLTLVLHGGTRGDEDDAPGMVVYGPEGPESTVALTMIEGRKPGLSLNHPSGGWVAVTFSDEGRAVILMKDPDGRTTQVST